MERKKREGPIWKFCFWATLVCSSFAGSNGVGGHLENQGKHAGGSQAIWNRFRPSRLLHSMNLPFPPHLLTICAHTHIHTYTHTHTWTFRKNTCDRAFGWLFGETTTKKNFEAHSLTFYILTSICFFSSSIHRQHFPFTFFFSSSNGFSIFPSFIFILPFWISIPSAISFDYIFPSVLTFAVFLWLFFFFNFLILTFILISPSLWQRKRVDLCVCVHVCFFQTNSKTNKREPCVFVCVFLLSLSLPNICSQTYSVLMS